uniref:Uncharacterized protein n=1 Tax=Neogobius melanostomus TaxID=47308 RepID=A0A8C6SCA2_9GOBI
TAATAESLRLSGSGVSDLADVEPPVWNSLMTVIVQKAPPPKPGTGNNETERTFYSKSCSELNVKKKICSKYCSG